MSYGEIQMNDQTIEQEIQAKGLTAPRVTPDDIRRTSTTRCISRQQMAAIGAGMAASQEMLRPVFIAPHDLQVLVLRNGFTGESVCASPDNFDAELGRKDRPSECNQQGFSLDGLCAERAPERRCSSEYLHRRQADPRQADDAWASTTFSAAGMSRPTR